jgi:putative ABC transport system permease protein
MLVLKQIEKKYKVGSQIIKALDSIDLAFRKQEFVCVIGPSGCGKTTLLNIIGGLDRYSNGELIIEGKGTKDFSTKDWDGYRNDSIGFVFQNYQLIPHLSVYENIAMALVLSGISRANRKKKVLEVLEKVDLLDQKDKRPRHLSGGQMQRVAIARALVNDPAIILADEPTGALDSKTADQIVHLLKEISENRLVIMVTHNEQLAKKYGTRNIYLLDGRVDSDSNPYDSKQEQQEKKKKRTSMSYWAALVLSFKNLITKRLRTLLTVFAGSVGIVGVTLVLTISHGVSVYMEDIQKVTLANFPITIRSVAQDPPPDEDLPNYVLYPEDEKIFVTNRFKTYYGHVNIFSNQFLSYLNALDDSLYNVIDYRSRLDMKILTNMDNIYRRVSISRFIEMSDDVDYIETQYDVLYGKLPSEPGDLAILVDRYNTIDVTVLSSLGIDFTGINEYTFDEIAQKEYRVIRNNDFYFKQPSGIYATYSSSNYETMYHQSAIPLQITGIIRISRNATTNIYDNGILYSTKLTELVINDSLESDIVQEQLAYGLDKNVFTGLPFVDEEYLTVTYTKEYRYEGQLATLTAHTEISTIRIYTDAFVSRIVINDYLKAYNDDLEMDDRILYTDQMGNIIREFDTFIEILTRVLIAFAAVSLFVSTIMIGIITYVSVMERIREIGILRSLGARRKDIARVFNAEVSIIGFASGVLGVLLGILFIQPLINVFVTILEQNNITTLDLTQLDISKFHPLFAVYLIGGSVLLTLVAGFIPAIIAAFKSPVNAIKSE